MLATGALWGGVANWTGFDGPEPVATVEPAPAAPDTATTTGTVAETKPVETTLADPARPNELSRTLTGGGSAIIQVRPSERPGDVVVRDPAQIGQAAAMAHLPLPELLETVNGERLPRRSDDGLRPFDAYARPWSGHAGPRIALVVGGLGLSQTGTQSAIARLASPVTLAFASEGNSLGRWMQTARREGHEIILQVPMEPLDYPSVDPGRMTLTLDGADNTERLDWALGRTTNYTGIMNYMGAAFTADSAALKPVLQELGDRGLMYLDDGTSARSTARDLAGAAGVPFAQADIIVDTDRSRGAILSQLNQLEQIARSQGVAVGVGSAFDETVAAVTSWMNEARKRGIEFIPLSAAALDPERRN